MNETVRLLGIVRNMRAQITRSPGLSSAPFSDEGWRVIEEALAQRVADESVMGATGAILSLEYGKYTFYMRDNSLHCDRYREPWREFVGDKAVTALFQFAFENTRGDGVWRKALEDELICAHIFDATRHASPKAAIDDLIEWNCKIALDPKVSSDAAALIELGAQGERSCNEGGER